MNDIERYLATLTTTHRDYTERLATVKAVLDSMGNPQDKTSTIHIAGTSGKGSTAYYAAEILKRSGYTTGLAVSPHVNSVAERSQVDGQVLSEATYCSYFNQFASMVAHHNLSYIEFLTVFTYWLFAELNLSYSIVEVGLGGRLDPTNSITRGRTVRVITDIGLDHTEILGDTLAKIAGEKAGIIHSGDKVVMHEQPSKVMNKVIEVAGDVGADLIVEYDTSIRDSKLPVFQQRNWTLARRAVATRLTLDGKPGISHTAMEQSQALVIPGRFEYFVDDGVVIILDAAHNPQKMSALMAGVAFAHPRKSIVCMVAFGENKSSNVRESLQVIRPGISALIATTFTSNSGIGHGAIPPRDLAVVAQAVGFDHDEVTVIDDPYDALRRAVQLAKKRDLLVVVTGSFYLIDGIRALLLRGPEKVQK